MEAAHSVLKAECEGRVSEALAGLLLEEEGRPEVQARCREGPDALKPQAMYISGCQHGKHGPGGERLPKFVSRYLAGLTLVLVLLDAMPTFGVLAEFLSPMPQNEDCVPILIPGDDVRPLKGQPVHLCRHAETDTQEPGWLSCFPHTSSTPHPLT